MMLTSFAAGAVALLRPPAPHDTMTRPLELAAATVVVLLAVGIPIALGIRRDNARDTTLHGGLTAARRGAIRTTGARVPAVALAAERIKSHLRFDDEEEAMVIVAEVRSPGQPPYRVEIHAVVPCYPMNVGSGPLIRVDTPFFVFVDPADSKTVVIDVVDLRTRELRSEDQDKAQRAEAEARAAREAAEKRERLLRGE